MEHLRILVSFPARVTRKYSADFYVHQQLCFLELFPRVFPLEALGNQYICSGTVQTLLQIIKVLWIRGF